MIKKIGIIIISSFLLMSLTIFSDQQVLPEVTLKFATNLHSKTWSSDFNIGVWGGNFHMFDPNEAYSFGMFDVATELTRVHGENDGPPGTFNQVSITDIEIYHDSQYLSQDTDICILRVKLDADTSKLLDAHWIKNESYQPKEPSVKPAQCSFSIAYQAVNIAVSN